MVRKTVELKDLEAGQEYNVQIRAVGDNEAFIASNWSTRINFTTDKDVVAPLAPPVLDVTVVGSAFKAVWDVPVNNEDGSNVEDLKDFEVTVRDVANDVSSVYYTSDTQFTFGEQQNETSFGTEVSGIPRMPDFLAKNIEFTVKSRDYAHNISAVGITDSAINLAPGPVTLVDETNGTPLTAQINWDTPTGNDILAYRVRRRNPGTVAPNWDRDFVIFNTDFVDAGLSRGNYTYVVEAYDKFGNFTVSNEVTANVVGFWESEQAVPDNPTIQNVATDFDEQTQTSAITFDVTGPTTADAGATNPYDIHSHYEVRWSTSAVGPFQYQTIEEEDNTGVHSIAINGLKPNTTYHYGVKAISQYGRSGGYETGSITTDVDSTPPAAPANPVATGSLRNITVSWDSNTESDLAYYELFASQTTGFTPGAGNKVYQGNGTGFAHQVGDSETWYYVVKATDTSGNTGDPSVEASDTSLTQFQDDQTAPSDVVNTQVATTTYFHGSSERGYADVSWDAATDGGAGIGGYVVASRIDAGTWTERGAGSESTTYRITDLEPGTTIEVRVKAVDNRGNLSANWSNVASDTVTSEEQTAPSQPGGVNSVSESPGSASLSWQPVSNVQISHYEVEVTYLDKEPDEIRLFQTRSTEFTVSGFTNGSYSFRVRAVSLYGVSGVWSLDQPFSIAGVRSVDIDSVIATSIANELYITFDTFNPDDYKFDDGTSADVARASSSEPVAGAFVLRTEPGASINLIYEGSEGQEGRKTGLIPYDESKIYKITVRVKESAADGLFFAGFQTYNELYNPMNTSGSTTQNAYTAHWCAAQGEALDTGVWYEFTGYMSGRAAEGVNGTSESRPNADNPAVAHEDTRFIGPAVFMNFLGDPTSVQELDFIKIESVDLVKGSDLADNTVPGSKISSVVSEKLFSRTLGVKANVSNFAETPSNGDLYLHGFDSEGDGADVDGYLYIGDTKYDITKQSYSTSQAGEGWLVFDTSDDSIEYVQLVDGNWKRDNGTSLVDFTPTDNHYVIAYLKTTSSAITKTYIFKTPIAIEEAVINTARIIAGSVTTESLEANAVTANKLNVVVGGGNLVKDSGFETDVITPGSIFGATLAPTSDEAHRGARSLSISGGNAGSQPGISLSNDDVYETVEAGENYAVSLWVKADATGAGQTFELNPTAHDGAGTRVISPFGSNGQTVVLTEDWQRIVAYGENTHTSALYPTLDFRRVGSDPIVGTVYVDSVQIEAGDYATSWSPATDEILPGTIVANMVELNTLTSNEIDTATIAADTAFLDELNVGGKIVVGSDLSYTDGYDPSLKAQVFSQPDMPTGGTYRDGDIWIDTNDANRRWVYENGSFQRNDDTRIQDALNDAADAATRADQKNLTFYKATAPVQADLPTGAGARNQFINGDLWFNISDDNHPYVHTAGPSNDFVDDTSIRDGDISLTRDAADAKNYNFYLNRLPVVGDLQDEGRQFFILGDLWYDTANDFEAFMHNGKTYQQSLDTGGDTVFNPVSVRDRYIDTKARTFFTAGQPSESPLYEGDIYFDTNDGNKPYRYNGSAWQPVRDAEAELKTYTFFQGGTPVGADLPDGGRKFLVEGDLWINTSQQNELKRYNGTTFQLARDETIADAQLRADNAFTSADEKNLVFIQATKPVENDITNGSRNDLPTGSKFITGDIWIDNDDRNRLYVFKESDDDFVESRSLDPDFFLEFRGDFSDQGDLWYVGDGSGFGAGVEFATEPTYQLAKNNPGYTFVQSSEARSGGYILQVDGATDQSEQRFGYVKALPINPDRVYRLKVRYRLTTSAGSFYAGIADMTEDFAGIGGANWILQSNASPAANVWTEAELTISTDVPGTDQTFDATARWFRPAMIANYNEQTGVTEVDYFEVEDVTEAFLAQQVADGKATVFRQGSSGGEPVALAIGDVWYDTDQQDEPHYWNGSNWISVRDGKIADARAAAEDKNLVFTQDTLPVIGDIPTTSRRDDVAFPNGYFLNGDLWINDDPVDGLNEPSVHSGGKSTTFNKTSVRDGFIVKYTDDEIKTLTDYVEDQDAIVLANAGAGLARSAALSTHIVLADGPVYIGIVEDDTTVLINGSIVASGANENPGDTLDFSVGGLGDLNQGDVIEFTKPVAIHGQTLQSLALLGRTFISRSDRTNPRQFSFFAPESTEVSITYGATTDTFSLAAGSTTTQNLSNDVSTNQNFFIEASSPVLVLQNGASGDYIPLYPATDRAIYASAGGTYTYPTGSAQEYDSTNASETVTYGIAPTGSYVFGTDSGDGDGGDATGTIPTNALSNIYVFPFNITTPAYVAAIQPVEIDVYYWNAGWNLQETIALDPANEANLKIASQDITLTGATSPTMWKFIAKEPTGRFAVRADDPDEDEFLGKGWFAQDVPITNFAGTQRLQELVTSGSPYTFVQANPPDPVADKPAGGRDFTDGDLWIDTDDNQLYSWVSLEASDPVEFKWISRQDAAVEDAAQRADAKNVVVEVAGAPGAPPSTAHLPTPGRTTYIDGDIWIDTTDGNQLYIYGGTSFSKIVDGRVVTAQDSADEKTITFYQPEEPVEDYEPDGDLPANGRSVFINGDTWFDTDDEFHPYVWENGLFKSARDGAGVKSSDGDSLFNNPSLYYYDSETGPANGWSDYSGPNETRVQGRNGSYAVQFNVSGSGDIEGWEAVNTAGIWQDGSTTKNYEYLTLEVVYKLISGSLNGAGLTIFWSGNSSHRVDVGLHAFGSVSSTGWQSTKVTIERPTGAALTDNGYTARLVAGDSVFGVTNAAKVIQFDRFNVRPASEQEIEAYNAEITLNEWATPSTGRTEISGGVITTNTVDAEVLKASNIKVKVGLGTGGAIESSNFVAGTSGFRLDTDSFELYGTGDDPANPGGVSIILGSNGLNINTVTDRLWFGASSFDNAEWRVDADGSMRIGGTSAGDPDAFYANADGDIWSGNSVQGSAPWTINSDGSARFDKVTITGDQIDPDGQVINVGGQFIVTKKTGNVGQVDLAGTMNVNASGDINVNGGNITLTGGDIRVTGGDVESANGWTLGSGVGFRLQGSDGKLYAQGADVQALNVSGASTFGGTMTTSGTITSATQNASAGWTITNTGTATFKSVDIDGGTLNIGTDFSVTNTGVLFAAGADIEGDLTATTGTLKDLNILGTLTAIRGNATENILIGEDVLPVNLGGADHTWDGFTLDDASQNNYWVRGSGSANADEIMFRVGDTDTFMSYDPAAGGLKVSGSVSIVEDGVDNNTELMNETGTTITGTSVLNPANFKNGTSTKSAVTTFASGTGTGNGAENKYVQINFDEIKNIAEIRAFWSLPNTRSYWYKIQYSRDNVNWYYAVGGPTTNDWVKSSRVPIDVDINQVSVPTVNKFEPRLSARYIRIYGDGNTGSSANELYELEIYETTPTTGSLSVGEGFTVDSLGNLYVTSGNIGGDLLVGGTLDVDAIQSNSIEVNKLIFSDSDNLVPNPSATTESVYPHTAHTTSAAPGEDSVTARNLLLQAKSIGIVNGVDRRHERVHSGGRGFFVTFYPEWDAALNYSWVFFSGYDRTEGGNMIKCAPGDTFSLKMYAGLGGNNDTPSGDGQAPSRNLSFRLLAYDIDGNFLGGGPNVVQKPASVVGGKPMTEAHAVELRWQIPSEGTGSGGRQWTNARYMTVGVLFDGRRGSSGAAGNQRNVGSSNAYYFDDIEVRRSARTEGLAPLAAGRDEQGAYSETDVLYGEHSVAYGEDRPINTWVRYVTINFPTPSFASVTTFTLVSTANMTDLGGGTSGRAEVRGRVSHVTTGYSTATATHEGGHATAVGIRTIVAPGSTIDCGADYRTAGGDGYKVGPIGLTVSAVSER